MQKSLAEIKPGETAEEMASRGGLGTVIGAAAPVVVKGIMAAAKPVSNIAEGIFSPNTAALRDLTSRSAKEGAKPINVDLFSPEEFALRVGSSAPPKLTDVAGSKGLLEAAAARFGQDDPRVRAINTQLNDRLQNQSGFIGETIDRGFSARAGQPVVLDAVARRDASDALARANNAPLYNASYSHPNAASISDSRIISFLNTNEGRQAYDWASNQANMRTGFYGASQGASPVRNPFVISQNNQVELAPGASGASLAFLDLVKRGTNEPRKALAIARDTTGLQALDTQVKGFTDFLKTTVPPYGTALSSAGKFTRGNNAFEAGENLYEIMVNPRTVGELGTQARNFQRFSTEEQQLFREGYGTWIKENPIKGAALFKGGTPNTVEFRRITKDLLGDVAFKEIDAGMRVARVSSLIDAINAKPSLLDKMTPGAIVGAGGGTLGAISALRDQLPQIVSHPAATIIAGVSAVGLGANRIASSRKLEALLDMASSTDRAVAAKAGATLQQIAAGNTGFDKYLGQIENKLSTYLAQTHMLEPNLPVVGPLDFETRRQGRASGGKVNSTSIADRLVMAAESAKRMSNKATEPLLRTSDESIAKALEVANRHI